MTLRPATPAAAPRKLRRDVSNLHRSYSPSTKNQFYSANWRFVRSCTSTRPDTKMVLRCLDGTGQCAEIGLRLQISEEPTQCQRRIQQYSEFTRTGRPWKKAWNICGAQASAARTFPCCSPRIGHQRFRARKEHQGAGRHDLGSVGRRNRGRRAGMADRDRRAGDSRAGAVDRGGADCRRAGGRGRGGHAGRHRGRAGRHGDTGV